jgi:hypothetical protein
VRGWQVVASGKRQTLLAWFPDGDAAWQRILAAAPRYADYAKKTDRLMPVIRLAPLSAPVS